VLTPKRGTQFRKWATQLLGTPGWRERQQQQGMTQQKRILKSVPVLIIEIANKEISGN